MSKSLNYHQLKAVLFCNKTYNSVGCCKCLVYTECNDNLHIKLAETAIRLHKENRRIKNEIQKNSH